MSRRRNMFVRPPRLNPCTKRRKQVRWSASCMGRRIRTTSTCCSQRPWTCSVSNVRETEWLTAATPVPESVIGVRRIRRIAGHGHASSRAAGCGRCKRRGQGCRLPGIQNQSGRNSRRIKAGAGNGHIGNSNRRIAGIGERNVLSATAGNRHTAKAHGRSTGIQQES